MVRFGPAFAVVAVALAASLTGLGNDFAQDDLHLIANDPRAHSPRAAGEILTTPYWPAPFHRDLYRPFATLSFTFQWVAGGGSPLPFRVLSYLLYALVSLGVFRLARLLLPAGAALAVALLFAAHPVHVEAVALGVNQGEQWVALLSLLATVRYIEARRRGWVSPQQWGVLGAFYLLACLFKESALVLPGLLIAAELTLFEGRPAERLRRLWLPFTALAAVGAAFLAVRTAVIGDPVGSFTAEALVGQGVGGRTLTMLQVVPHWLRVLVWPAHLLGDYSPTVFEPATRWGFGQTLGVGILLAAAGVGWLLRARAPAVPFGLLLFAVAIFPVSNVLVPTAIVMAERTFFLPSAGFLLAVVAGVVALLATPVPQRTARVLAAATALLVLAGVARSAVRHRDWKDHFHFWSRTAEDAPGSYKAHYAVAGLLVERGDMAGALRAYETAAGLHPPAYWVLSELGDALRTSGDCVGALERYAESLGVEPMQPSVRLSRVSCLMQLGRLEEAMAEANQAVEVQGSPTPGRVP